ncbi:MAG: ATP-dependent zinc metalloprotease FtsH [Patescibacteria group bacterium]|nr:ATP-dependent zinc metalloprotease FtsH [Patescibacteria group bacterium]
MYNNFTVVQKKNTKKGKSKKGNFDFGFGKKNKKFNFASSFINVLIIFLLASVIYSTFVNKTEKPVEISMSEFVAGILEEEVKSVSVEGEKLLITFNDDSVKETKKEVESSLSESLANYGILPEQLSSIDISIKNPSGFGYWFLMTLPFLIPILFILIFIWYLSRQVKGANVQAFSFGSSKARFTDPSDKKEKITFKDVAGVKEAKEELNEIVDFLKNPKKFLDIGAQIPKGVILMGSPGTGKTLLARAVAGEAKVPFFSISGSEFVEMFVGVGASRVRDLFKTAKKTAPAIIFIDEIDAVGRVRGTGVGGGNDEREQTLNQILVEMDGFDPNGKVIVIAATNRPDVLDPALLRPGRFDRRVTIDLPDRSDREAILEIHSKKKPFADDVVLRIIAERTPGFSGADLYSLMNEGAILAAREGRKKISQFDLIRSIEKVMLGPERKSHIITKKEKEIIAYHEVGHALTATLLENADPVHKISVISRGQAAGYTIKLPDEEKSLYSKKYFLDDIGVSLGGYLTEKIFFGDVTTGASNDLQVASKLARNMVTKYGMSEKLGPIAFEKTGKMFLQGYPTSKVLYSEETAREIDREVDKIIQEMVDKVKILLENNKKAVEMISKKLMKVETLERDEYEKLLILNGIEPNPSSQKDNNKLLGLVDEEK